MPEPASWVRSGNRCEEPETRYAKMSRRRQCVLPYPNPAATPAAVLRSETHHRGHPRQSPHSCGEPIREAQGAGQAEESRRLETGATALRRPFWLAPEGEQDSSHRDRPGPAATEHRPRGALLLCPYSAGP